MAEIDTSSYPKPALPVAPLTVQQLGAMQQQKLQIDQSKLDQANQALGYMTRAMGSLGPDASKDDYIAVANNAAKMGLVPPDTVKIFAERAAAAPDSKSFYNEFMTAAAGHQEQIDYHLGKPGTVDNGQQIQPVVSSVKPGFGGVKPLGLPIQQQPPPTAPTVNASGQPQALGAQAPQLPVGAAPAGAIPGQFRPGRLPVEQPAPAISGPTGPTVDKTPVTPTSFANRFPTPQGPVTGTPPLFDEGKKAYTEDQLLASQKMTAIKPAILGLNLIQGMKTGPGTEAWNKGVAFLKAQGLIKTEEENDPTAIYQEANKYFSQYLKGRGGRSDADLAAAEKSSPNVGVQLNPALQKLAKSAVAQDMIEAARPSAFGNRTDYQNYGQHRAAFPQSMDQRAFEAAIASPEERQKLVDQMHNKYKKNPNDPEALKFFRSLDVAKKADMFGLGNQ
jgi:hypothetical protein